MAERQIHGESSTEVQTETACEETSIGEMPRVRFPMVPVQPESSQSESSQSRPLSTSSGDVSSPVFSPRRRRLRSECSDSDEDEKPAGSTTSDDKDVNSQPFRRRTSALDTRNSGRKVHKRKKVSSV